MTKIVRLTTEQELRAIHAESFINNTTKVNKVNDHSVLSGFIVGNAKTAKKALKDIALATSHLFPDDAVGNALDQVAADHGIADRFVSSQSSTFVRLAADAGTLYQAGVHTVFGNNNITFDLENDITIGSKGFDYVKVRSQTSGILANIDAYIINQVSPVPGGHIGVINEYGATGGRDNEQDDVFRRRIKEGPNILAKGTLSYITQAFINVNSNVLRVIFEGTDMSGKIVLAIATQNGIDLTAGELSDILVNSADFFSLTEINPIGTQTFGIVLKNVEYQFIDVDFRFELFDVTELDAIVKDIQVKFAKAVDFRFWDSSKSKVEADDLLEIVKNAKGVKYVPDTFFIPGEDIVIARTKLPRFRGFIARGLDSSILLNQTGTIDPVFYPNDDDTSFTATVL